ncbi:hypothetical protein BU600_06010 [Staphylococcus arlettae]|nr:DUF1801 domain-containing protein [Staphylococcus arlettae]RIM69703.1 hypothetical protein BU600_06010 [Staphylococcus arlettae]
MNEKVTNAKVDTFINNLEQWQDEFKFLRKLSLDTELEEEFKWKHPCYTLNDKNVVIIQDFKHYCALLFEKGAIMEDKYDTLVQLVHYFNGISDSSYVQLNNHLDEMTIFSKNAPSFNRTYTIPFDKIAEISAPVILCGPIGKDAHKVGERVYKKSAFEELPIILETIIKKHFV